MIVDKTTKLYITRSDKPNTNWTSQDCHVVDETTAEGQELAQKIIANAPCLDFVLNDGKLIDITPTARPEPTAEELRQQYEALAQTYIREHYSLEDELKIHREYVASPTKSAEFEAYNAYVEDCKARAKAEVYGEETV